MYKRYLGFSIIIAVVCVVTITAAFTSFRQQEQSKADEQFDKIVDYKTSKDSSDDKSESKIKRDARNKLYDREGIVFEPHPQAGGARITRSPWLARLPALPVALSDTIIVGEITDAQAYLSDDKTGVYTETTVKVGSVIKSNSNVPISDADTVEVQRSGGRVRFPSGQVVQYSMHRQGIPKTGRRYVLFLKYHREAHSFAVITGYELRAGRVFLLDGEGDSSKATLLPQFARFKNMDESAFLSELQSAVQDGVSR